MRPPILTAGGSDSTGQSGIGADIQTIAALGGHPLAAVTCLAIQDTHGQRSIQSLSARLVCEQVGAIIRNQHPRAIKVGLIGGDSETVRLLRDEVIACSRLVVAPGIFDSDGHRMVDEAVVQALLRHLVPEAMLLVLRARDAEGMLQQSIRSDDDMLRAARLLHEQGAQWVLLRGSSHTEGRLTALLSGPDSHRFFSSYNTDGWQRHGVAGAFSAAITTRLGMGDDVPTAVLAAHDFIHSQVVYRDDTDRQSPRAIDIYNNFVSLLAENYALAHHVGFYADRLCITPRYLSQATARAVGKSPRQIIADYLMSEARSLLASTRLDVQEVADRLGFSSQALFSKFFKQQCGLPPRAFRQTE